MTIYSQKTSMYYERTIEQAVRTSLLQEQATIVTGMRRVGKTTLLRRMFDEVPENKIWFDFENPIDVKIFEDMDYNDVYRNICTRGNLDPRKKVHVFVDEVQLYPAISKVVKYLMDHKKVKFVLTGSASYYLKRLFPESLAGRKILLTMYPLNFEEFLRFQGEDIERYRAVKRRKTISELDWKLYEKWYEEFIEWGGFPEVVLARDQEKKRERLGDIFGSYYQQEVVNLADYHKGHKVRDLILLLAARVGSQLDIVKLSQELGIQRATVYAYLAFLQDTYFIHLVSRLSQSIDREVSGTQKVYFCDNGILQSIAKVNAGQLLENAVFNQLKHKGAIRYYRKTSGAEIDFILEKKIAYEVKRTATPSDVQELQQALSLAKLSEGYVVSQSYGEKMGGNIIYGQFL